jgi:hypothetical protein
MPDDHDIQTEATELLRTLIRNACVNTGDPASGQEVRSVDALEDYFAGSGVATERHTSEPGRTSLIARIVPDDLAMGNTSSRISTPEARAVRAPAEPGEGEHDHDRPI